MSTEDQRHCGLVLSGGGARGAYQAGVIRGLCDIASSKGIKSPFGVVTGVSAGAINASFWASNINDIDSLGEKLVELWASLTTERVFRTDIPSLSRILTKWAMGLMFGGMKMRVKARSLLDTSPLYSHLKSHVDLHKIPANIEAGLIRAVAVTATDYASSCSITFVQGQKDVALWERTRRIAERVILDARHLMASSAIPLFFPPITIGDRHFGDGCLRNAAPLSPAIHLGADRLVIVGVRRDRPTSELMKERAPDPAIGRILSVIMNAILMDAVDSDLERVARINQTLAAIPESQQRSVPLRPIDYIYIQPSQDLGKIALEETSTMPKVMRYLVRGLGSERQSSEMISYLLFEPSFSQRIAELGYQDAMARHDDVLRLIDR